ncbi:hypothetical protein KIN20_032090 [Parelaphostrongylus tenuis]|uniref:Uncharacterized protein n=1 Tax=Parelaphostrongylus tenuis TaxID=148309 RepID=A0AAD5R624_PARTN|nr:hypothetical protein KIN20_032090 [Parelaphostrongylus tenuis]
MQAPIGSLSHESTLDLFTCSSPMRLKMIFLVNKAGIPTDHFMISLLATISTVFGCGVMPAGQGSTRNFTVTGFTLPVAMAYSTSTAVLAQLPGIATSEAGAKGFVERLVMQTVVDVLESQARSALLPDAVISAILSQLTVIVNYTPLECPNVRIRLPDVEALNVNERACIIIGNTVTAICSVTAMKACTLLPDAGCENNACVRPTLDNFRITFNHQHYHGELVKSNVAKCSKSSDSNVGIGSIRIALLLGSCHCRRKLKLNCDIFRVNTLLAVIYCRIAPAIDGHFII